MEIIKLAIIQNKKRLSDLINTLRERKRRFEPYQEYLEIHAGLGQSDKQKIHQYKDTVQIIFMTASASRGLSFPNTKHIKRIIDNSLSSFEKLLYSIPLLHRPRRSDCKTFFISKLEWHCHNYLNW